MDSAPSTPARSSKRSGIALGVLIGLALAAPVLWFARANPLASVASGGGDEHGHSHEGHDHAHDGAGDQNSLELSPQARASLRLRTGKVELGSYNKMASIPGIVVERRGQSRIAITAPLTGVVSKIYVTEGESVAPSQLLFEMRLTHEELVQSQADLLRTVEELQVIGREIERIKKGASEGIVAGKVLLEREYEQHKQEAALRAQRQSLILHGLSEKQVETIISSRTLLKLIEVRVPSKEELHADAGADPTYQVQQVNAELGQQVAVGEPLAMLTDHAVLLIEGEAFEQDNAAIQEALAQARPVSALLAVKDGKPLEIKDLKISYQSNQIDPKSRVLHFYVTLPNRRTRDTKGASGKRFVDWLYNPGQRVTLRVPMERLENRIVVPAAAVAEEGVETYVFRANGAKFERQPVHVEYRDQIDAVLANDGSVFPGEVIALSGAQQMQIALKNKAGGGVDPHAGHNH